MIGHQLVACRISHFQSRTKAQKVQMDLSISITFLSHQCALGPKQWPTQNK